MARLLIHVEREFEGEALDEAGAVATIIPLDPKSTADREALADRLIPAGQAPFVTPASIEVPPGDYVVQARLPSGQIINSHIRLDEGEEESVVLTPDRSTNEWLSLQSYVGEAPTYEQSEQARIRPAPRRPGGTVRSLAPRAAIKAQTQPDDLTRLRGVGKTLAKRLNERGFASFDKMAKISKQQRDWLEDSVPGVRGRFERYDWAGQAKALSQAQTEDAGDTEPDELDDDFAAAPALPEPQLAYFFVEEGGAPPPVRFYHALKVALESNRSGAAPLDVNASQLCSAGSNSPISPPWADLKSLGHSESNGPVSVLALRSGVPYAPDHVETYAPLRRVYFVADDGEVQWLSILPIPWADMRSGTPVGIDITFDRSQLGASGMGILPRDARLAPLLGFLRTGDVRAGRAIVKNARDLLFEKVVNPYSAAAGGYVLVSSMRWGGQRRAYEPDWFRWIENLRAWNPWLPDARIQLAWLQMLAGRERLDEARAGLLGACQAGLPVYSGSFQLLIEGLRLFRDEAASESRRDDEVDRALAELDLASLRIDPRQIFTTVRLTPRQAPTS
jgi:predicted flap endonuclease-1-like 5' DNA nuclease